MRVARTAARGLLRQRQQQHQQHRQQQPASLLFDAAAAVPAAAQRDQFVRAAADCAAAPSCAFRQLLHSSLLVTLPAQPRRSSLLVARAIALRSASAVVAAAHALSARPRVRLAAHVQLPSSLRWLRRPRHPQQPPFPPAPSAPAAAAALAAASTAVVLGGVSPFGAEWRPLAAAADGCGAPVIGAGWGAAAAHLPPADLVRLQSFGADTADVRDFGSVDPWSLDDRLQCYQ